MSDNEVLRSLNESVAYWEQRRDDEAIDRLDGVLSPDLLFRRANGEVVDKGTFMAGLNRPSQFASRASEVVSVDLVGQRAMVVVMVTTTDAESTTARFRNVRTLVASQGGWRIDFWFNDLWHDEGVGSL